MPRKRTAIPPTDDEIMAYSNVPVELAAPYIGWSTASIYYALQEERAPFGIAAKNNGTETWSYNISPGLLVKYKHGELPAYKLHEIINLAAEGVDRIISARLAGIDKIISSLEGVS
ncbi:MAG: hypothetical protein LKK00_09000 [Intestinimonas sp.]|jgi:hypothetical protein|nr:hypothetical protein [Intestinimonas sp.]